MSLKKYIAMWTLLWLVIYMLSLALSITEYTLPLQQALWVCALATMPAFIFVPWMAWKMTH